MASIKYAWTMFLLELKATSFFRFSFIFRVFSRLANVLFYYVFFEVLFRNVKSIGSWGRGEIFMLIGTMGIITGLSRVIFGRGAPGISRKVRYGHLDILFSKPIPGIVLLTISRPEIPELIGLAFPIYLFFYGLKIWGHYTMLNLALYGFALVLSFLIYNLFNIFIGLFSLKAVQLTGAFWIIEDLFNFSRYPFKIFPVGLRYIFFTVLPVLAVSNLPVLTLIRGSIYLLPLSGLLILFSLLIMITYPLLRRAYQGSGTVV